MADINASPSHADAAALVKRAAASPEAEEAHLWVHTGLQVMAEYAKTAIYPDGISREESPGEAAASYQRACEAADALAAAAGTPQGARLKPDAKLLEAIRGGAVRTLDAFLAMVPPNWQPADWLTFLAEGAGRYNQGEYAWPAVQLGAQATGVPLPPPFTSVYLPDSRIGVMRSDWTPRAHYLAVNDRGICSDLPRFALSAFGETMLTDCGPAGAGAGATAWTAGLFFDGLALAGGRSVCFAKPVGDLPGYWLLTEPAAEWQLTSPLPLQGNGGLVTASAGPGRPGLQIIPAQPLNIQLDANSLTCTLPSEMAVLLAPYERVAPAPGSFQIQTFPAAGGRCYRIVHHLGYDVLVISSGESADYGDVDLTTDARFALIRVRGGVVVAHQASRCSRLFFRGEELSV